MLQCPSQPCKTGGASMMYTIWMTCVTQGQCPAYKIAGILCSLMPLLPIHLVDSVHTLWPALQGG